MSFFSLRYGRHPYGVPKDDKRYDISLIRRVWWELLSRIGQGVGP